MLVVIDKFATYMYLPTSGTMNQEEFTKLFMMKIARHYGLPMGMVADQDPTWAKSFWCSVADELGLELLLSTSHHPQTDGQSEWAIQHLAISLRAFIAGNRSSWVKWIPELEFTYNSTPLSSVGQSPFFLLHGYHP